MNIKSKDFMRIYMKDCYDDDSVLLDFYEDDSFEEEGEIDDFMYKLLLLCIWEFKEVDLDDELDVKCFDLFNDEMEYLLDKSKVKYVKKYFKFYLIEEKICFCILEDVFILGNEFLNFLEIDDYIEDLVVDYKFMKFLKMYDLLLKFVQKCVVQCMGLVFCIWEELDKVYEGYILIMDIEDVVKLLEKIIFMIGQVNVVCFYEWRINFFVKIFKSIKKVKSMLCDNEVKFQDDIVLFGNDFYVILYWKLKDRK